MSLSIEEAVRNARYNEAVIVTVSNGEDESQREIVLVAALDKVNGGVSWQDATTQSANNEGDIDIGIQRHMRTKKWAFPMLNDDHRNKLYESSIRNACVAAVDNLKEGQEETFKNEKIRILDIGSGTGLLAMLSSKCMNEASTKDIEVVSIEMASAMARLARKTVEDNGLGSSINIIEGHSCEDSFEPYVDGNKAILCTSELLETGLLGEGMIPALRDAWNRHLAKDAIVVPQRARVFAQVLEGKTLINQFRGPRNDSTRNFCVSTTGSCTPLLGGKGGGFRVPIHAGALFGDLDSDFHLGFAPMDDLKTCEWAQPLSQPTLVMEFDFTSKDSIPAPTGRTVNVEVEAIKSGTAHGVLFWWELDLWSGETYSTELGKCPWQDHWQQCLYVFGGEDDECETLEKEAVFTLTASHDDTSISFNIFPNTSADPSVRSSKKARVNGSANATETLSEHISFDRALQLNDCHRMNALCAAIGYAIEVKGTKSVVLDISDFSLCSIIASKSFGAENVTSVESASNEILYLSAIVAQIGNQLPQGDTEFKVLQAYAEKLSFNDIGGAVDIVLAEPYYQILEGWHLQEALNYFYLLKGLKTRGVIKDDSISVPSFANVMVCAIQLDESIALAHSGLKKPFLQGFSHSTVSKYGKLFSTYDLKMPMSQYKWKRLSENFCVAKIQYDGPAESMVINGDGTWVESELKSGKIHGIAIWIDYKVRFENEYSKEIFHTITTGNRHHQQAFRFVPNPSVVSEGSFIKVKVSFADSIEDHDIDVQF